MSNTSATGGYLVPSSSTQLPGGLTLNQFLQTVLVGVSGLDGSLVRPDWQVAPPKQPDLSTNWIAFGVSLGTPDIYSYVALDASGANVTQRHQEVEVPCSFYGPGALDVASFVADGFQITQNLEALRLANMGFVESSAMTHIPDLVNERFIDRVTMTLRFRREIQRVYPILSLVSANGTIHTVLGNEQYLIDWDTLNVET